MMCFKMSTVVKNGLLPQKTIGPAGDLPDGDTSFTDSHVTEEDNLVMIDILARVVVEG